MNRNIIILVLILIFATVIRIVFYNGIQPTDDIRYYQFAHKIFIQNLSPPSDDLAALRPGILIPIGMMMKLFGPSVNAVIIFFLLVSFLL